MKYLLFLVATAASTFCAAHLQIDAEEVIEVGGIRHAITIQAKDTTNPIFLFLHGGPGGSVMNYAERFTGELSDDFIVVHWDQRETGKTLALNASPTALTLDLFQRDTYEMVRALLHRFNDQKLYLAGHSWGTALGFYMARSHPELLHAYVCIGPMIHQLESERMSLAMLNAWAAKRSDEVALRELSEVRIPFENGTQLYYHRKWLQKFSGSRARLPKSYVEQWAQTWLRIFNEASAENLFESLPEISCPIYFVAGRKDYQTNSSLASEYYAKLRAPRKEFVWFDTGHSIPSVAGKRLQEVIAKLVLDAPQPTVAGAR